MLSQHEVPRRNDARPGCILRLQGYKATVELARRDGTHHPPVRQYPHTHRYASKGIFDHLLVVLQTNGDRIFFASLTTFGGVPLETHLRGRRDEQQKFQQYLALAPAVSHPLQGVNPDYAPLRMQSNMHRRMRRGYIHVNKLFEVDRRYTRHRRDPNDPGFRCVPELEAASLQRLLAVTRHITGQNLVRQPQQQPATIAQARPQQHPPPAGEQAFPQQHLTLAIAQPTPLPHRVKWSSSTDNYHFY